MACESTCQDHLGTTIECREGEEERKQGKERKPGDGGGFLGDK